MTNAQLYAALKPRSEGEPIFSPAARFTAEDMADLHAMAEAARPINDQDWGSDRQIAAENDFHEQIVEMFGCGNDGFSDEVSCFVTGTKMTTDEAIDWAMESARDAWANISAEGDE